MHNRRCRCLALLGLLLSIGITPAAATDVCVVLKSGDGFVALRASPSADAALVARAKPGEAIVIQQHDNGDRIARGTWLRVFHFPGDVIPPKEDPAYRKGRIGWMHRRYVGDCG